MGNSKRDARRDKPPNERQDAEYVAVLKDLEPAGTAEFAEEFGVSMDTARGRLEGLRQGDHPPVDRKKIGGSLVWFVDESELEASAETAAEEIRERMGLE
jgi:hypothetical protein